MIIAAQSRTHSTASDTMIHLPYPRICATNSARPGGAVGGGLGTAAAIHDCTVWTRFRGRMSVFLRSRPYGEQASWQPNGRWRWDRAEGGSGRRAQREAGGGQRRIGAAAEAVRWAADSAGRGSL